MNFDGVDQMLFLFMYHCNFVSAKKYIGLIMQCSGIICIGCFNVLSSVYEHIQWFIIEGLVSHNVPCNVQNNKHFETNLIH